MQMTHEQLVNELYEVVMELHFARRRMGVLEAENEALRAQLAPNGTDRTHFHGEDGKHTHN